MQGESNSYTTSPHTHTHTILTHHTHTHTHTHPHPHIHTHTGAVDWVMMQCCFDHYFMLVLEKQERHEGHQQFFAVVQIIGTGKQAEGFRYTHLPLP